MRVLSLAPLLLAAAVSALPAPQGATDQLHVRAAPGVVQRDYTESHAAAHARAHQSGGFAHGKRRLVRRRKERRKGKCVPKTTVDSTTGSKVANGTSNLAVQSAGGEEDKPKKNKDKNKDKNNGGDWNSNSNNGDSNNGSWNNGDSNKGDSNNGSWNNGDSNKGDSNNGSWNNGDSNKGDSNNGSWNNGDSNNGDWNNGNSNKDNSSKDNSDWQNNQNQGSENQSGKDQGGKDQNNEGSQSTTTQDDWWSPKGAQTPTSSSSDAKSTNGSGGNVGQVDGQYGGGGQVDKPSGGAGSWSTAIDSGDALTFDQAFLPLNSGSLPEVNNAPDGSLAFVNHYPAGKIGGGSGYNFYSPATGGGRVNVEGARDVTLSYSIFFADGFEWKKGGKLPGLYGGTSKEQAKSCSGGRQNDRENCFSARMMWRADGMGELYNYFPPSGNQGYCNTPPKSVCNPDFGDSIGRGSFHFQAGTWNKVEQRVKLNDVGQANGEQTLTVNGQQVLSLTGLTLATSPETKFYGVMGDTFFGGGDNSFAPTSDQTAWFKDWALSAN